MNIPGITLNVQEKTLLIDKDVLDQNLVWYTIKNDKYEFVKGTLKKISYGVDDSTVLLEFEISSKDNVVIDMLTTLNVYATLAEVKTELTQRLLVALDGMDS